MLVFEDRGTRGVSLSILEVRSESSCGCVKMEVHEAGAGVEGGAVWVGLTPDIAVQVQNQE